MRNRLGIPDITGLDVEAIIQSYAEVHARELPEMQDRLKQLHEEQRLAIKSLSRLPDEATHAISVAKLEIAELDRQIRELPKITR